MSTDGGSAFASPPVYGSDGCGIDQGSPGMSLRAYFAAKAMAAMIATATYPRSDWPQTDTIAIGAVKYADALIAELNKPRPA